ncbi:hypothetical protein GCM10027425_09270 [Alteromonas gracilis]
MPENNTETPTPETPTEAPPVEQLPGGFTGVPDGVDPLDGLLVGELGHASRIIGVDVVEAVLADKDGRRWDALPAVAWLWAKRLDPKAKLEPFKNLPGARLYELLGMSPSSQPLDELEAEPAPEDQPDTGAEDVAENPTESAPE